MERKGLGKKVTGTLLLCTFLRRRASGFFGTPPWLPLNCLGIPLTSRTSRIAIGSSMSRLVEHFCLTQKISMPRCTNFSSQRTEGEKISASGCCFWRTGRQGSRCLRSLIWPLWRHFWVPKTLTFWVWQNANSLIWKWLNYPVCLCHAHLPSVRREFLGKLLLCDLLCPYTVNCLL